MENNNEGEGRPFERRSWSSEESEQNRAASREGGEARQSRGDYASRSRSYNSRPSRPYNSRGGSYGYKSNNENGASGEGQERSERRPYGDKDRTSSYGNRDRSSSYGSRGNSYSRGNHYTHRDNDGNSNGNSSDRPFHSYHSNSHGESRGYVRRDSEGNTNSDRPYSTRRYNDNNGNSERPYGNRRYDNDNRRSEYRSNNYGNSRPSSYDSFNSDRTPDDYGNRIHTSETSSETARPKRKRVVRPGSEGNYTEQRHFQKIEPGQNARFSKPRYNNNNNDRRSSARPVKPFKPIEAPQYPDVEYTEPVRLNKYIANTGLCSRREADEHIKAGKIMVNGTVITELGVKVNPTDTVAFNGEVLVKERKIYLLLNKPKGFVTSVEDEEGRKTVMELVHSACKERIYPVGRLDKMTTGVLLFTNDGELALKLTHPANRMRKVYHVQLDRSIPEEDLQRLLKGVELDDGFIAPDGLAYANDEDTSQVGMEIHSGRNRIVRRMFEAIGYKVEKLDRVYFAGLSKKGLKRGKWRFLSPQEVAFLKMMPVNN